VAADIDGAIPLLARDILQHWMNWAHGKAEYCRPRDAAKCQRYAELAVAFASKLVAYQSPTFKTVMIAPPAQARRRFTLTVIDRHNDAPMLDDEVDTTDNIGEGPR